MLKNKLSHIFYNDWIGYRAIFQVVISLSKFRKLKKFALPYHAVSVLPYVLAHFEILVTASVL